MSLLREAYWLAVLSLPVACVSWTVCREEILREPREWLENKSQSSRSWWATKFFYVWTCEYCFSHYVAGAIVLATHFHLLLADWRGVFIAWLSLVAVSNLLMSIYSRVRVEIHKDQQEIKTLARRAS
jgi:hypothetical protein